MNLLANKGPIMVEVNEQTRGSLIAIVSGDDEYNAYAVVMDSNGYLFTIGIGYWGGHHLSYNATTCVLNDAERAAK